MAFKKGDRVEITGHTMGGKEVVEGTATLVECFSTCKWWVHFDGDYDGDTYTRDEAQMELITS